MLAAGSARLFFITLHGVRADRNDRCRLQIGVCLDLPSGLVAVEDTGVPLWGINATADTTNRLAVKSTASLFDNVGNGHQQKINKAAAGDTASTLYQTGYSGRAEYGLTGDDNFHVKVSPNGSSWSEAMVVDRNNGNVGFGTTPTLPIDIAKSAPFDFLAGYRNTHVTGVSGFKFYDEAGNYVGHAGHFNSVPELAFVYVAGRKLRFAGQGDHAWFDMNGGNVGVDTASPSNKFSVEGIAAPRPTTPTRWEPRASAGARCTRRPAPSTPPTAAARPTSPTARWASTSCSRSGRARSSGWPGPPCRVGRGDLRGAGARAGGEDRQRGRRRGGGRRAALQPVNCTRRVKREVARAGARTHYGLVAQEVKAALDAAGAGDFAGWVLADRNDPRLAAGAAHGPVPRPADQGGAGAQRAQRGARGARGGAGGLADTHLIERLCACDLVPGHLGAAMQRAV